MCTRACICWLWIKMFGWLLDLVMNLVGIAWVCECVSVWNSYFIIHMGLYVRVARSEMVDYKLYIIALIFILLTVCLFRVMFWIRLCERFLLSYFYWRRIDNVDSVTNTYDNKIATFLGLSRPKLLKKSNFRVTYVDTLGRWIPVTNRHMCKIFDFVNNCLRFSWFSFGLPITYYIKCLARTHTHT